MKSKLIALTFLSLFLCAPFVRADENIGRQTTYPKATDPGGVSSMTYTSISVTTTPALILSTGGVYGLMSSSGVVVGTTAFTSADYMSDRLYVEIYNDSGADVWLGGNIAVSTQAGATYGRRLPDGNSICYNDRLINHYIVSGATTSQKVVITQIR